MLLALTTDDWQWIVIILIALVAILGVGRR